MGWVERRGWSSYSGSAVGPQGDGDTVFEIENRGPLGAKGVVSSGRVHWFGDIGEVGGVGRGL